MAALKRDEEALHREHDRLEAEKSRHLKCGLCQRAAAQLDHTLLLRMLCKCHHKLTWLFCSGNQCAMRCSHAQLLHNLHPALAGSRRIVYTDTACLGLQQRGLEQGVGAVGWQRSVSICTVYIETVRVRAAGNVCSRKPVNR